MTIEDVIEEARSLLSEDENPEYDRALFELVTYLQGRTVTEEGNETALELGINDWQSYLYPETLGAYWTQRV